ncbi:hypothetical protein SOVF_163990 [Spinacia oleracea]|nr:hypothetical protein SOVF_163990 [Spinacia oleracea]
MASLPPNTGYVFQAVRNVGVKVVVSNFDTRLRPLLRVLTCEHWFDVMIVSAKLTGYQSDFTWKCLYIIEFELDFSNGLLLRSQIQQYF